MIRTYYIIGILCAVPLLSVFYFNVDFAVEADRVFLTISTFLFSIFTGFFISRQASRFNRVRESVTQIDGKLTSLYRLAGHFSTELQSEIAQVLERRYNHILETMRWDQPYTEKTTTLPELHALLDTHIVDDEVSKLRNQALGAMIKSLAACQSLRKQVIALTAERIPREQWLLILFFAAMLIATVSTLPTADWLFAILKAAFVVSVFSVLYILYQLNNLNFTEHIMGERSARDVLEIIAGTK